MKFNEIKALTEKFIADNNLISEDVAEFVMKLTGKNTLENPVRKGREVSAATLERIQKVQDAINVLEDTAEFTVLQLSELTEFDKSKIQYAFTQLQEKGIIFIAGKLEVPGARGKKPNLYSKVL